MTIPVRVEHLLNDAIESAITNGVTPLEFISATANTWRQVLSEQAKDTDKFFNSLFKKNTEAG